MMDASWETTVHGDLTLEGLLDADTFDAVRDDEDLNDQFREMVGLERAEIYRYEGDASLVMMVLCDDTVLMCGHDEEGPAPGTIETDNEGLSVSRSSDSGSGSTLGSRYRVRSIWVDGIRSPPRWRGAPWGTGTRRRYGSQGVIDVMQRVAF